MAVVQGGLTERGTAARLDRTHAGNLPQWDRGPTAASMPETQLRFTGHGGQPDVTSYSLHKGAADKTKCDVVVAGVVRTKKGLEAAPGGEGIASAYGRKFRPLLSTVGFEGKPGEVVKIPTGGTLRSPLMILVGLGEAEKLTPEKVRRAAGAAARSVSNAANVALALPTPDADHVRAVAEGFLLGTYAFTEFKTSKSDDAPGEVVCSPTWPGTRRP